MMCDSKERNIANRVEPCYGRVVDIKPKGIYHHIHYE